MTDPVQPRAATAERRPSTVKAIVSLGLPLVVGAVATLASGLVDMAMIGRYGSEDLVAVSSGVVVFDVLSAVVLASLAGYQILAPRFIGGGSPAELRRALRSSARFSGAIALAAALLVAAAGGPLAGLVSGADTRTLGIAGDYLAASAPYLVLLVPFGLLATTFNSHRRPRPVMAATLTMLACNTVLDWLLIYGPGPLPELGAVGCGLATTASGLVGVFMLMASARRSGLSSELRRPGPVPPVAFPTSVPALAWPAIVSQGLDYVAVAAFFAIVGTIGENALAGGRIAFQTMILVFGLLGAFAAGGRILIGRAMGEGELGRSRALWRSSQHTLLWAVLPIAALMVAAPHLVAGLFTDFTEVRSAAEDAIRVIGLCLPLMAWTLGGTAVLRALGRTKWDMYSNLVGALLVQLPIGWLGARVAGLGIAGAFLGVAAYWIARGLAAEILARRALRAEEAADGA